MQNKSRAFTLIELLVVVLIIGILAAVAIPQYETAVWRARFANYRSVAASYKKAIEVYQTETSAWPPDLSVLSVNLPGETETLPNAECVSNAKMYCCLNQYKDGYQDKSLTCGSADYQIAYMWKENVYSWCVAKKDTAAERACQSIVPTARVDLLNLPTPTGHRAGYRFYRIAKGN